MPWSDDEVWTETCAAADGAREAAIRALREADPTSVTYWEGLLLERTGDLSLAIEAFAPRLVREAAYHARAISA